MVGPAMSEQQWLKVGDAARATGLTVRALHHYDESGLVRPSERTAAGHRLYGMRDLARLELERHRAAGTDPADPAVQALAERGDALFAEFHGGDPELIAHAAEAWKGRDPAEVSRGMVSAELWSYYGEVRAARR